MFKRGLLVVVLWCCLVTSISGDDCPDSYQDWGSPVYVSPTSPSPTSPSPTSSSPSKQDGASTFEQSLPGRPNVGTNSQYDSDIPQKDPSPIKPVSPDPQGTKSNRKSTGQSEVIKPAYRGKMYMTSVPITKQLQQNETDNNTTDSDLASQMSGSYYPSSRDKDCGCVPMKPQVCGYDWFTGENKISMEAVIKLLFTEEYWCRMRKMIYNEIQNALGDRCELCRDCHWECELYDY